ncbi:MAG: arylformamidase [Gemmatimonadota bacterium]|nr:arylformamidase [Gemmatimonadota bacterium]
MLYDITRPISASVPVWPGDTPFRLDWTLRRAEGASVNLARLEMSPHTGTHADAPFHVAADGARMAEVPLDAYLGPARVVEACGWREAVGPWIVVDDVERALAGDPQERLLFRTGCWTDLERFPDPFPGFAPDAARRLVDAGVRLVGTDAPSVDPFDSKALPAHHILREGGVANLENLLLDGVPEGEYELVALPLRLEGADASPVRAVLRSR